MCKENINLQFRTKFTSFGHNTTSEVYDKHIFNRVLYIFAGIWNDTTLFCIASNGKSKIEKVPRVIRGEKSSKDMASSRNLVSRIGAQASPTMGTEPGVRKGKRSMLACHTRCKCSMETTHNW